MLRKRLTGLRGYGTDRGRSAAFAAKVQVQGMAECVRMRGSGRMGLLSVQVST